MVRKVLLAILAFSQPLLADLDGDLKHFFDKFNSTSAVNAPDAYQGQLAGHLTGGSATLRNKVVDSKLVHVSLPSLNGGCGGIDIYTGGFSFIGKEELVNALKSIGSNAMGYSFLLALETVSPQVANTVKQLQTWANTINSLNINSCETAAQLVGAVWPRQEQASQHICRSLGVKAGIFDDFISARHGCREPTEYRKHMDRFGRENTDMLIDSYNVAWEVLKKQTLLKDDQQLRRLFMSLTGTVVIKKDPNRGGEVRIESYLSKIFDPEFLNTLLHGGDSKGYACSGGNNQDKCLQVAEEIIRISSADAWLTKMQTILSAIQEKIFLDEPLSESERQLINSTQFPLYKVINVMSAYSKGRAPIDLYQCASIVATDLLCQFIREVIQAARESAYALRSAQMNAEPIDQFIEELHRVEMKIKELEVRNLNLLDQEFKLIQKIELIEEKLRSQLKL